MGINIKCRSQSDWQQVEMNQTEMYTNLTSRSNSFEPQNIQNVNTISRSHAYPYQSLLPPSQPQRHHRVVMRAQWGEEQELLIGRVGYKNGINKNNYNFFNEFQVNLEKTINFGLPICMQVTGQGEEIALKHQLICPLVILLTCFP